MCILHVPVHPWCTCTDPTALNPYTNLPTCPHHIWIQPDLDHPAPSTSQQPYIQSLLSRIPRPSRTWEHCKLFEGRPTGTGHEASCPNARVRMHRCAGLCADCDHPDSTRGIPLALIPLRERWVVDEDPYLCWQQEFRRDGVERVDGAEMEKGLSRRIMAVLEAEEATCREGARSGEGAAGTTVAAAAAAAAGSSAESPAAGNDVFGQRPGVFVDIVQNPQGGGRWGVFTGRSGVYLLPGFYDASLVEGMPKKKAGWAAAVVAVGKMVGELANPKKLL